MSTRDRVRIYVIPQWARICGHLIDPARCRAEVERRNGRWQCPAKWKATVKGHNLCGHHAGIALARGIEVA